MRGLLPAAPAAAVRCAVQARVRGYLYLSLSLSVSFRLPRSLRLAPSSLSLRLNPESAPGTHEDLKFKVFISTGSAPLTELMIPVAVSPREKLFATAKSY